MLKLSVAVLLLFFVMTSLACSDKSMQAEVTPEAWAITANDPPFTFLDGFFGEEGGSGHSWRWMGPSGFVALKNPGRDAVLTLQGSCPLSALGGAPIIKITFNDQVLEEFPGTESFQKTYSIPRAKHGMYPYSDLRITSSKSFVPQEVDKNIPDTRRLALQISQLTWPAAPSPSPSR